MAATNVANDDCTPAARVTMSPFGYGVLAGPFYVLASVIDGATRPGFDFARDSWSVLSLGSRGWVHITVFILTGLFVIAAAVAFRRHFAPRAGRVAWFFLAVYGLMLILAGIFQPDPTASTTFSIHGLVHLAVGGLGFIAFAIATFIVARRFARERMRGTATFSIVAGVVLLVGFVLVASLRGPVAVLSFTAAVILSWAWLSVVSVWFYREADAVGRADAAALKSSPVA